MASSKLLCSLLLQTILSSSLSSAYSGLFREYIGAEGKGVTFAEVPIHPDVEFHFILSFAIDYTRSYSSPNPTNGLFDIFWDSVSLNSTAIAAIKKAHPNVRVALSVGGATVGNGTLVSFQPSSVDSWVENAVSSLTKIIQEYGLDGIDIDYEQFAADDATFAECIGRLITTLKEKGVISFASIAPFDTEPVQSHYLALWKKYGSFVDYVNFQFYAYANTTSVSQFLEYFDIQNSSYSGGEVLVSVATDETSGGLRQASGFFDACGVLHEQGKLHGIFIWSADDSKKNGFQLESLSQNLLANNSAGPCTQGCSAPSGAGGFRALLGGGSYFYYYAIFIAFLLI